ncbi:MTRF1L release factor glutamine methyltransferase [Wyeomyia smithii]|uniref:MTRF1L release factor glutamine methyltransferase n=1 Tax=Wyeomyia smithii TaxID=174621 RepID=UPI002467EE8C|nr:MTRF1L release factor glutamine methyltransferase [Wyeomyia smithii]
MLRSIPWLLKNQPSINVLVRQEFCSEALRTAKAFSVGSIQEKWETRFKSENIPEAGTSIINILAHVLQLPKLDDVRKSHDLILSDSQLSKIDELCQCRLARMPIQYIIREWEFRDITLKMIPPVFIPRPETEELVELILQQIDTKQQMTFLEIGCGSGAIVLSILKHVPLSSAIALDQNRLACELTLANAQSQGLRDRLRIFKHKLVDKLPKEIEDDKFDMIISNPPYVPSGQLLQLEPEIKIYEDLRALDGGADGLAIIRAILELAGEHLNPEGTLWLEVDSSHPEKIAAYLDEHESRIGLKYICSYKDLFRNERFVEIMKV